MVVDYEEAWSKLSELVATKPQHGRQQLLTEMAQIQADCRVPSGELARLLRLYGVEVERIRRETDRDSHPDSVVDSLDGRTAEDPAVIDRRRSHDGSSIQSEAAVG